MSNIFWWIFNSGEMLENLERCEKNWFVVQKPYKFRQAPNSKPVDVLHSWSSFFPTEAIFRSFKVVFSQWKSCFRIFFKYLGGCQSSFTSPMRFDGIYKGSTDTWVRKLTCLNRSYFSKQQKQTRHETLLLERKRTAKHALFSRVLILKVNETEAKDGRRHIMCVCVDKIEGYR